MVTTNTSSFGVDSNPDNNVRGLTKETDVERTGEMEHVTSVLFNAYCP